MNTVRLIYSRSRTVGGLAIRAASWWAQWCHCGIITPELTVIEARVFEGVVETPLEVAKARSSAHQIVTVDCPDPVAAIAWARSKKGCGYDYGAIVEFVLREPFEDTERYECVELIESALMNGGRVRFRVPLHSITPHQSFIAV